MNEYTCTCGFSTDDYSVYSNHMESVHPEKAVDLDYDEPDHEYEEDDECGCDWCLGIEIEWDD